MTTARNDKCRVPGSARVISLRGLECPFTWGSAPRTLDFCRDLEDKLCLTASPWGLVQEKLVLAYSLFYHGERAEGRALLAECYVPLLPQFHTGCGLIDDYSEALRHVLDSTWAVMCVADRFDANLEAFIAGIVCVTELSAPQRSAVSAMEARVSGSEVAIRHSVALQPAEGEWLYTLGWMLQEDRGQSGAAPSAEELRCLRDADRLRRNADTITRLARSLADGDAQQRAEAQALADEALRIFPDSPRALTQVANVTLSLRGSRDKEVLRTVCRLYRRVTQLVGDKAFLSFKLSMLYSIQGRERQSAVHALEACVLNPATCAVSMQRSEEARQERAEGRRRAKGGRRRR